ncbi:MAG: hypothetical protein GY870_22350 [archaeon]|nr:hypothetical protein [archaeon]
MLFVKNGKLVTLSNTDWKLILPYLKENEELFGILIEDDLLTINGNMLPFDDVYRKVMHV